jgi:hypothetical protein
VVTELVKHAARPTPWLVDVARAWVGPPRGAATALSGSQPSLGVNHEGTAAFRRRAVGECLDTIGMLRSYREPGEGEFWRLPAGAERRMLAQVDAVLALGPSALEQAEAMALDPDVPDADHVFAALFVLGCTVGMDVARGLPIFTAALQRDAGEAAAAVEAWCLCPSQAISEVLGPLLRHPQAKLREAAVKVLGYRGELGTEAWCQAVADPEPSVAMAALAYQPGEPDHGRCERALLPLLATERETLLRSVLRAGLCLGLPRILQAARDLSARQPDRADALCLLAQCGLQEDLAGVERAFGTHLPAAMQACALAGWCPLGGRLLAVYKAHAGDARLGAQVRATLSTILGLPDDAPADLMGLGHAWGSRLNGLDTSRRYRHGLVWNAATLTAQLRESRLTRPQRQALYQELQMLTRGRVARFSAFDFIGVQHDALERIALGLAA